MSKPKRFETVDGWAVCINPEHVCRVQAEPRDTTMVFTVDGRMVHLNLDFMAVSYELMGLVL